VVHVDTQTDLEAEWYPVLGVLALQFGSVFAVVAAVVVAVLLVAGVYLVAEEEVLVLPRNQRLVQVLVLRTLKAQCPSS
jgi:hypothetical protein